jgi:hypothetical protein
VFRNGVRLGAADFTASNGTSVVLASAATLGDLVVTESFYVSSVLNAIPATANAVTQTAIASGVAGTGPAFYAYTTGSQTISSGVLTKATLDTERYDTNNCFASSTFTPTVAGYYQINASIRFDGGSGTRAVIGIYKNGSAYSFSSDILLSMSQIAIPLSTLVYMNGTTDYIDLYGAYTNGSTATIGVGRAFDTYMNGFLARAA